MTLSVVRVYCKACGHTHALLLSSFVPYSQIPFYTQFAVITAYESAVPLKSVLSGQCTVDENNIKSIIRSYRLHWRERLRSARLSLTEGSALVIDCFSHFSRQLMQIKSTSNKLFILPT